MLVIAVYPTSTAFRVISDPPRARRVGDDGPIADPVLAFVPAINGSRYRPPPTLSLEEHRNDGDNWVHNR